MLKNKSGIKGNKINIVGGKYDSKTGWMNEGKEETACFYYVCIKLRKAEKWTRVRKEHVAPINDSDPVSFPEAVLQQHSDVNSAIENAARLMAKCRIGMSQTDLDFSAEIFKGKILAAHNRMIKAEGKKVAFCETEFDEQYDDFEDDVTIDDNSAHKKRSKLVN